MLTKDGEKVGSSVSSVGDCNDDNNPGIEIKSSKKYIVAKWTLLLTKVGEKLGDWKETKQLEKSPSKGNNSNDKIQ